MSNSASEQMLQAVAQIKERARAAQAECDRRYAQIQQKASKPIDLFGGDAASRVVDIRSDVRLACDDLYTTLQTLVIMLDSQCRCLLTDSPSAEAVHAVMKTLRWLNEESQIGNTFNASLNSHDLGAVQSSKYIPSLECKMIEKFWEETFHALPEAEQICQQEEQERKKAEQKKAAAAANIANLKRQFDKVSTLSDEPPAQPDQNQENRKAQLEEFLQQIRARILKQKNILQAAQNKKSDEMREFNRQIFELEKAWKEAGIFRQKKRKELRAQITDLQAQQQTVKASHEKECKRLEKVLSRWEEAHTKYAAYGPMMNPEKGTQILFGTDPLSKKAEQLPWIVVQVSGNKLALLSRDIIGYGTFKDAYYSKKKSYIQWLKDFEKDAFTSEERQLLFNAPIRENDSAQHAFVFTKEDADKHLQAYLKAKPSKRLLDSIENDPKLSSFDKQDAARAVQTAYWLHSQNPLRELTAYFVKSVNGKWETRMLGNVTNDEYTLGIRPAILLNRSTFIHRLTKQLVMPSGTEYGD